MFNYFDLFTGCGGLPCQHKECSKKQVSHALKLLESHSYKQVEELTEISKSTLIRVKIGC
ncbi:hypothetical protein [Peribacillus frigoritolerans]|uniref:hypothetical protein n=1 Tax=Peribacillus frigoritolerans TaxID=450367 RepID=UPI003F7E6F6B